jgi:xylono-1,5-lactonase
LRTLYVSSARSGMTPEQLEAEPFAGGLFAVPVDIPGRPAALFGA